MSVQAWFGQDEISVRPGESTSLSLSIENVGDHTESYTIIPAGLTAAWTTVTRPNVTLFGGSRDVVEVVVRPPAIHLTSAGPTALAVRVLPQTDPEDAVVAETIVGVEPFDDRRVTVLQPMQRARRRATYEFLVENHGNNLASCRLHLVDASNRVDGSFDPPAIGVAPGSNSLVRLKLRARHAFFRRGERQLDFEIEATEPDHEPAAGHAALIQPPTIPAGAIAKALGVAAVIAAVIAAWFGIVRPELRDAAERAVDDQLAELPTVSVPTEETVPTTTLPVEIVEPEEPALDEGVPHYYRIAVDAPLFQTSSDFVVVPPDSEFLLTDVVLQNPNGDLGTAQLLRNGDVLFEWPLGALTSPNEFQPRITPIPFAPSDNIVLSVECAAASSTAGTVCEIAVLIGGRLVPADFD